MRHEAVAANGRKGWLVAQISAALKLGGTACSGPARRGTAMRPRSAGRWPASIRSWKRGVDGKPEPEAAAFSPAAEGCHATAGTGRRPESENLCRLLRGDPPAGTEPKAVGPAGGGFKANVLKAVGPGSGLVALSEGKRPWKDSFQGCLRHTNPPCQGGISAAEGRPMFPEDTPL